MAHEHGAGNYYHSGCYGCQRLNSAKQNQYNKENRDKQKKYKKDREKRFRSEVNTIKLARGCENPDCTYGFVPAIGLDFHHKNPTTKVDSISRMIKQGVAWKTITKEIEKCEVLCAICHRIATHEE